MELVDAQSEHVSAEITLKLLAIEGIKPDDTARIAVNVDVRAGYVIDLSGDPGPREPSVQVEHRVGPAIDALPERQPPRRVLDPPPVPSFSIPAEPPVDVDYRPEQRADGERRAEIEQEFGQERSGYPDPKALLRHPRGAEPEPIPASFEEAIARHGER